MSARSREIYLPAFEASVREARVGAIMDSYNLVNGVHSTQNRHINVDILKHDWGFDGIVMSDWDATYDGVAAANNGLDLEMPAGKFMSKATLIPAIKEGKVSESTIDDKVRRIPAQGHRIRILRPGTDGYRRPALQPGGQGSRSARSSRRHGSPEE